MKHLKEFIFFFVVQAVGYALLTYNFRSLAAGRLTATLASDAVNAGFGFVVIRRIAKSDDSLAAFAGYVAGSLGGTYIGMVITQ